MRVQGDSAGAMIALVVSTLLTRADTAGGYSCHGPDFWQAHRRATTVIYGVVAKHIDKSTPLGPRADFVVEVREVLRGHVDGKTVTFRGWIRAVAVRTRVACSTGTGVRSIL